MDLGIVAHTLESGLVVHVGMPCEAVHCHTHAGLSPRPNKHVPLARHSPSTNDLRMVQERLEARTWDPLGVGHWWRQVLPECCKERRLD